MSEPVACAAIILAAGASTRLGQQKQLVRIDGETMLRRTTQIAIKAGCAPVVVVLGSEDKQLTREVDGLAASVLVNHEWQTGMASSLKTGLQAALTANSDLPTAMILVCDQPRLDASILRNLLMTHSANKALITASHYRGANGVPAIFSRKLFPELLELTGDQGARRIIQLHLEQVASVDFPGGEIDIDTPGDLAKLDL